MLAYSTAFAAAAAEPTGASLAFTSSDPVVLNARKLVEDGKFREADELLNRTSSLNSGPDESAKARLELGEIIKRTRYEYSLTPEELLKKVQTQIPDASAGEVDHWAKESKARFRMIDGQKYYFRREPQNIWLFSASAKARQKKAGRGKKAPDSKLLDHMAAIIAEAERTGETEVLPVKHRFTHTLTIQSNLPALKGGSLVRVWLPFPQEYRQQRDVKLISSSPAPKLIAPPAKDGNPVTGAPQRTVYFETHLKNITEPLVFQEVVEFTSYGYYPKLDPKSVEPLPGDWNGANLGERPPHIVFAPEIQKEVKKIVGHETNPIIKAQKLFRWVSANIPWNAEDEYCILPSFALKGFNARRGDCGVQNTVFITMCRIAGIPARWQSGFETKPGSDSWGMHDWAEIYIAPWGWLPADASYGVKPSKDQRVADFYCGHQDSYRMIINLDWGRDLFPPKDSLRSEPADFQRGEVEVDGQNLYYSDWSTTTEIIPAPESAAR
jgi:transglutaminase-like putative cysteine protease